MKLPFTSFKELIDLLFLAFSKKYTNNTLVQFIRYTFVGGFAFIIDFSTLAVLDHYYHAYYLWWGALGFLLGLTTNYLLSIAWVFSSNPDKRWAEFVIFALIGIAGLGFNELFLYAFTGLAGLHVTISKIGSTIFVYLWNFFARKYILFNKSAEMVHGDNYD